MFTVQERGRVGYIEYLPPVENRRSLSKRRAALVRGQRRAARSHSRSPLAGDLTQLYLEDREQAGL